MNTHTCTLAWTLAASASLFALGCAPGAKARPDAAADAPPSEEALDSGAAEGAAAGDGDDPDDSDEDDWIDCDFPASYSDEEPAPAVGSGDITGTTLYSVMTAGGELHCQSEYFVDGFESICEGCDFAFDLYYSMVVDDCDFSW